MRERKPLPKRRWHRDQGPARKSREAHIPLEAALPAVIYEELTAAVARAEEARDEIPADPDDVALPNEQEGAAARPQSNRQRKKRPSLRLRGHRKRPPRQRWTGEEQGTWHNHGHAHSHGGGVISVPKRQPRRPSRSWVPEDALEELPQRHKRRWRHYKDFRKSSSATRSC